MASKSKIEAGSAFVIIKALDKTGAAMRSAGKRLKAFGAGVSSVGQSMLKMLGPDAIVFAAAARVFASFEDAMLKVKAKTQGTGDAFDALTDKAKLLGRTTSFTAQQVAEGMVELAQAGFDRTQIDNAIAGILDLSRATDTLLPRAAEVAGATLKQFGLNASESARVADVLTSTANGSAQTLDDLGEAMKHVGPIAGQFKISLEEVTAILGALANIGIKGSMAGSTLKNILLRPAMFAEKIKSLTGIEIDESNITDPIKLLKQLGDATKNMGDKDRLEAFSKIFGLRAVAGGTALTNMGDDIDQFLDKLDQANGLASKTAKEMDSGLGGSFRRLQSAVEGVLIALGDAISGPLGQMADVIGNAAGQVTTFIEKNKELVAAYFVGDVWWAVLSAGVIAVGKTIGGLGIAIVGLGSLLSAIAAAAVSVVSPFALITAGLVAGTIAFFKWSKSGQAAVSSVQQWFGDLIGTVKPTIDQLIGLLKAGDLGQAIELGLAGLKNLWAQFLVPLVTTWENVKTSVLGVVDTIVSEIQKKFLDLRKSMGPVVIEIVRAIAAVVEETANSITGLLSFDNGIMGRLKSAYELSKQVSKAINPLARVTDVATDLLFSEAEAKEKTASPFGDEFEARLNSLQEKITGKDAEGAKQIIDEDAARRADAREKGRVSAIDAAEKKAAEALVDFEQAMRKSTDAIAEAELDKFLESAQLGGPEAPAKKQEAAENIKTAKAQRDFAQTGAPAALEKGSVEAARAALGNRQEQLASLALVESKKQTNLLDQINDQLEQLNFEGV